MSDLLNQEIKLVTIMGKAGSGKTLLALAAALECRSTYRQILLARPTVPLSNRDMGYLPGDIAAKLDPYMKPLHDNLTVIRHELGDKDPGPTYWRNAGKREAGDEAAGLHPRPQPGSGCFSSWTRRRTSRPTR